MRHRKSRLRLKEKPAHGRMLARNLVTSLLLYESVRTTRKRAKVVQPMVDRLVGYARRMQPHRAIRMINSVVTDRNASRKMMEVYKDRYADRSSGLTRMVPVGFRLGDGAELVDLILVDAVVGVPAVESSGERAASKSKDSKMGKRETKRRSNESTSKARASTISKSSTA